MHKMVLEAYFNLKDHIAWFPKDLCAKASFYHLRNSLRCAGGEYHAVLRGEWEYVPGITVAKTDEQKNQRKVVKGIKIRKVQARPELFKS